MRANSAATPGAAAARPRPSRPFTTATFRIIALLALTLTATGCSTSLRQWLNNGFKVGPDYCEPNAPLAPEWVDHANPSVKITPAEDYGWWKVFNDPVLNGMIDTVYRQNLDLPAAVARIREARARRSIAVGNMFPQSQTAIAAYVHGQVGDNVQLPLQRSFDVWVDGFNASWELDLWGRLIRNVEAADANLDIAVEDYGNTLVMVFSEVATNYVQLRTFEQRLAYAQENVKIQTRSLELVQAKFEAGIVTELDLRQAKSSLTQTQAAIPPLKAGRRVAANNLCILLGMPVLDLANQLQPAPIPTAPPQIAVGIPADLLRKRPDVRRAERQVAAQSAQIGIAEADLYPRLSINGFIGYAGEDFNDMFDANSLTSFILPTLQWKILNYGRLVNNVRAQEALFENAVFQYQQSVLRAGREVEDALVQFIETQQQAGLLAQTVVDSQRAVEIAQEQFQGGSADFNRVFTNQAQLVNQQDQFAAAQGDVALSLIRVYRAMGGGWEHFCQGHGMPGLETLTLSPEELPMAKPAAQ